jgi:Ca2+-binding EF-hand superfamily protein
LLLQVEAMKNSDRSSHTKMAFKLFDMNKDGFITREEFKMVHTVK